MVLYPRLSQWQILLLQDFCQPPLFLRTLPQQGTHRRAAAGRRARKMHAGPQRGGLMLEAVGRGGTKRNRFNQRVTHFQRERRADGDWEGGGGERRRVRQRCLVNHLQFTSSAFILMWGAVSQVCLHMHTTTTAQQNSLLISPETERAHARSVCVCTWTNAHDL